MNGKRGRRALCTINKEDIKTMKQIKKLASLLLAAVLAMTLLAGCGSRGGNVGTAVTEQSILKYINEARANAAMGLSPVENDPTLAQAAATLLEEFAKNPAKANFGTGYKLTKTQAESILNTATGKTGQEIRRFNTIVEKSFFLLAPDAYYSYNYNYPNLMGDDVYLLRRGDKVIDPMDDYYGWGNTLYNFGVPEAVLASDMKVGIAFREINGERFALVVYDVTITPATPAP